VKADTMSVGALTALLSDAARSARAVPQPSEEPTITTAYAVQARMLAEQERRGARLVGVKLGFTSRAKMEQMGVDEVIAGFLLDSHQVPAEGTIDRGALIHPRVEPEIAFRLARDVAPDAAVEELIDAVDAVAPALEVIDSRYRDFSFRLGDVIADNTSAARFAVGAWQPLPEDLSDLGVTMTFEGEPVASGSTAAILGDPWEALRALRSLSNVGHLRLLAGAVILAGAATEAVTLPQHGVVAATVAGIGTVEIAVAGPS
jgi:2-oxo-3-hexenedioate decarboxylase